MKRFLIGLLASGLLFLGLGGAPTMPEASAQWRSYRVRPYWGGHDRGWYGPRWDGRSSYYRPYWRSYYYPQYYYSAPYYRGYSYSVPYSSGYSYVTLYYYGGYSYSAPFFGGTLLPY
jgi:hypothetical protein